MAHSPVADRIQALIAERGICPGERLPAERELAVVLGISRPRLREGMRRLTDLGVLEARHGSGTYLAALDVVDLLDARERLEPHAAALAAARRSAADVVRLEELLVALHAAVEDAPTFAAVDARIHEAVIGASGSLALRVMLAALADLLRESRTRTAVDRDVRVDTLATLRRLVAAIRERDADGAEAAMRDHLRGVAAGLRDAGSAGATWPQGAAPSPRRTR